MFYDRKIKYLDYLENGERVRGSGFVKLEAKDGSLRMDLTVTGLHPTDTFVRDVMFCTEKGETTVGRIEISGGKGKCQQVCRDLENLCGMGIGYEELRGLRIPLGTGREISCSWGEKRAMHAKNAAVSIVKTDSRERKEEEKKEKIERDVQLQNELNIQPETGTDAQFGEERDDMGEVVSIAGNMPNQRGEEERGIRDIINVRDIPIEKEEPENEPQTSPVRELKIQDKESNKEPNKAPNKEKKRERKMPVNLQEDKWSQLYAIYPHIRPFHDEREYLSIGPSDFVLFPSNSYKRANNSFLLHGYYNYNHLILVRAERKGEIVYYIGVPGNFFEKEKQVAIMFGFESFECAEEPAQAGDFGYYMMRTEL